MHTCTCVCVKEGGCFPAIPIFLGPRYRHLILYNTWSLCEISNFVSCHWFKISTKWFDLEKSPPPPFACFCLVWSFVAWSYAFLGLFKVQPSDRSHGDNTCMFLRVYHCPLDSTVCFKGLCWYCRFDGYGQMACAYRYSINQVLQPHQPLIFPNSLTLRFPQCLEVAEPYCM